jgi:hypothetical protein
MGCLFWRWKSWAGKIGTALGWLFVKPSVSAVLMMGTVHWDLIFQHGFLGRVAYGGCEVLLFVPGSDRGGRGLLLIMRLLLCWSSCQILLLKTVDDRPGDFLGQKKGQKNREPIS